MNTFISPLKQILTPARKRDSRRGRRFKCLLACRCTLLAIAILSGLTVTQAQQPDPLTVTSQGNVGIGTTTPANKLSVAGSADFSGNLNISGTIGIGTNSVGTSRFRIVNPASSTDFAHFRFDTAGGGEFEFIGWANGWNINSKTAGKNLYLNRDAPSNSDVLIGRFGLETIVKGDTGNVGIGTAAPANKLSVVGNVDFSGKVGIGTATPTKGKVEIVGSSNLYAMPLMMMLRPTPSNIPVDALMYGIGQSDISLYANGAIAAPVFYAFSDERIKRIAGRSAAERDLTTLMGIEVTDYSFVDSVTNGTRMQKKVTGQQVEKVFPQAVFKMTDVVPDIYQKSMIKDGWVMLATNLKKGERVRLIGEKQEGIHEILEVAEGKFRTALTAPDGPIFVYGREVNDARSVDYEAISMLNVSATQQIKKEKDEEIKALQDENAALRGQLAEQEKRLAAIESLLLAGDKQASRATSLKKVE